MTTAAIISEFAAILGVIVSGVVSVSKVMSGERCLLRSEMLRIYYRHAEEQTIRQYEFENFEMLYGAYKKLHGNSFIDKVHDEIRTWKVVS